MASRVLTKAAALRLNEAPPVEVVVFNERRPKTNKEEAPKSSFLHQTQSQKDIKNDFSLKKARFEVAKLAMSSLKAASKVEAKEALAISLGARPMKRKGVNYKELKAQRAAEKEAEEHEEKLRTLGKVLKRTGRRTATGKNMGSGTTSNKGQKGTPKAPAKLKTGILGKYGKVDKAKLKSIKSKMNLKSDKPRRGKR